MNQADYIPLGSTTGLDFGLGDGLNSLPILLGSATFQAFTQNAAQAGVGSWRQPPGGFRSAGDIEMETVLVVRMWSLLVNTEYYRSSIIAPPQEAG